MIDGETACGGMGLLVLAACAAARAGADKQAVAARVREARKALRIWFCLDTLEYLRRGGRVGKAQAWLGGTLKIKPILSLEYEITPVERVRTAGRAFERMVQYAQELHDCGADGWVVQHIQAPEQAQRLIDRCREIFDSEPVFTSEVGPVIGTYTGPGPDRRRRRSRARCWPDSVSAAAAAAQEGREPITRPTTTAPPIFSSRWWRSMCPRQSVRCVTSPRSARARPPAPRGWPRSSCGSRRRSVAPSDLPPLIGVRMPTAIDPAETVSRILCASSIAMLGTGGEPFLTTLAAIRPAITPSTTRITAIAKKPQK